MFVERPGCLRHRVFGRHRKGIGHVLSIYRPAGEGITLLHNAGIRHRLSGGHALGHQRFLTLHPGKRVALRRPVGDHGDVLVRHGVERHQIIVSDLPAKQIVPLSGIQDGLRQLLVKCNPVGPDGRAVALPGYLMYIGTPVGHHGHFPVGHGEIVRGFSSGCRPVCEGVSFHGWRGREGQRSAKDHHVTADDFSVGNEFPGNHVLVGDPLSRHRNVAVRHRVGIRQLSSVHHPGRQGVSLTGGGVRQHGIAVQNRLLADRLAIQHPGHRVFSGSPLWIQDDILVRHGIAVRQRSQIGLVVHHVRIGFRFLVLVQVKAVRVKHLPVFQGESASYKARGTDRTAIGHLRLPDHIFVVHPLNRADFRFGPGGLQHQILIRHRGTHGPKITVVFPRG